MCGCECARVGKPVIGWYAWCSWLSSRSMPGQMPVCCKRCAPCCAHSMEQRLSSSTWRRVSSSQWWVSSSATAWQPSTLILKPPATARRAAWPRCAQRCPALTARWPSSRLTRALPAGSSRPLPRWSIPWWRSASPTRARTPAVATSPFFATRSLRPGECRSTSPCSRTRSSSAA